METNGIEEGISALLHSKAMEASVRFLMRHDYQILDPDFWHDGERLVVARDEDDTIVFVDVLVKPLGENDLPEENRTQIKRARMERAGASWLVENPPESDVPVRFDVIGMLIIAEDRALLRHHINAFGSEWPE